MTSKELLLPAKLLTIQKVDVVHLVHPHPRQRQQKGGGVQHHRPRGLDPDPIDGEEGGGGRGEDDPPPLAGDGG